MTFRFGPFEFGNDVVVGFVEPARECRYRARRENFENQLRGRNDRNERADNPSVFDADVHEKLHSPARGKMGGNDGCGSIWEQFLIGRKLELVPRAP